MKIKFHKEERPLLGGSIFAGRLVAQAFIPLGSQGGEGALIGHLRRQPGSYPASAFFYLGVLHITLYW